MTTQRSSGAIQKHMLTAVEGTRKYKRLGPRVSGRGETAFEAAKPRYSLDKIYSRCNALLGHTRGRTAYKRCAVPPRLSGYVDCVAHPGPRETLNPHPQMLRWDYIYPRVLRRWMLVSVIPPLIATLSELCNDIACYFFITLVQASYSSWEV